MSWTLKGRITAYDNIAVGSATGRERTMAGVSHVSLTSMEILDNPAIGSSDGIINYDRTWNVSGNATSWHTSGPAENRFVGQTSYATSLGRPNQERLGTT